MLEDLINVREPERQKNSGDAVAKALCSKQVLLDGV